MTFDREEEEEAKRRALLSTLGRKETAEEGKEGLDKTHHLHESSEASERARLKGFRWVLTPPKRIETFGVREGGKPVGSELGVAVVKRV